MESHQRLLFGPHKEEVFDIIDAGPRSRFVIATHQGPVVAHNSGYAGWIGAWKAFGADKHLSEADIKDGIIKWREASPAIVEFWGGQIIKDPRRWSWSPRMFGLEGAFVMAYLDRGSEQKVGEITYHYPRDRDVMLCRLPSGRCLHYHNPRLSPAIKWDQAVFEITFQGWNTMGGGWCTINTYSGKLCENVVQAVSRDILTHALVNLEEAGYPIVMHVHDEIVSEVPEGHGSIEEFERIMSTMPPWAAGWPVKATGGWRGKRYRKD